MNIPSETLQNLVRAAFQCLADKSWPELTLGGVCHLAGIALGDLPPGVSKAKIGYAIPEYHKRAMFDFTAGAGDRPADMLFDILMLRYEAMEDDRVGVDAYFDYAATSPKARIHLSKSRHALAKQALIIARQDDSKDLPFVLKASLLSLVIRKADLAWQDEDSAVFSKTMVALQESIADYEARLARLQKPFAFGKNPPKSEPIVEDDIEIAR